MISAVSSSLQRIDARLMDHGERVAFLACTIAQVYNLPVDIQELFILSVFHDIGAYKTDEIDRMVEFETENVTNHCIYGHLFLKYLSPLTKVSEAILYHHTPYNKLPPLDAKVRDYAMLIHLADRMDIAFLQKDNRNEYTEQIYGCEGLFSPYYSELAKKCAKDCSLFEKLSDGSYRDTVKELLLSFRISPETALEFLKMLVFSIDFRSEHTVTHTVNTVAVAMNIARHFRLDEHEQNLVYLGALMHDVGKITIPVEILECSGRLTAEQMAVMRTHAAETENIIKDIVPEEVCKIASRHHEKLDGSGYPKGLTGDELDFKQRIVAVADIVSALSNKRSYKDPFPKEKTISILRDMQKSQLDYDICEYICNDYDSIKIQTDNSRNTVITKYLAMLEEFQVLSATNH